MSYILVSEVEENGDILKQYYIDARGKKASKEYEKISVIEQEGMIRVKSNGKWGFINKKFQEVVAPQYDEVAEFYEGLAIVRIGDKLGLVSKRGREVAKVKYDSIYADGRFIYKTKGEVQKILKRR